MAPEVLSQQPHDSRSDIYSLALLLWELWYGQNVDCYLQHQLQISQNLTNQEITQWPSLSLDIIPEPEETYKIFITQCWYTEPQLRPRIQVCLQVLYELRQRCYISNQLE